MARADKANAHAHQFKWKFFIGGLVSILVGYILLAMGSITLSPILLVLGYCILVPLSFL
jgi:hypothetical protein